MRGVLVLSTLAITAAAFGNSFKYNSPEMKLTAAQVSGGERILSEPGLHFGPGPVLDAGYLVYNFGDSHKCMGNPSRVSTVGLGKCRLSDANMTFPASITLAQQSQFEYAWLVTETFFTDRTCVEEAHSETWYVTKRCTYFEGTSVWTEIETEPNFEAYGAGAVVSSHQTSKQCLHETDSFEHSYFRIGTCIPNGNGEVMKFTNCSEHGEKLDLAGSVTVAMEMYSLLDDCLNNTNVMFSAVTGSLNCDGVDSWAAALENFSRGRCINAPVLVAPAEETAITGASGFATLKMYNYNDTLACDETYSTQVFTVGACVPAPFNNMNDAETYVKFHSVEASGSVHIFNFTAYQDGECSAVLGTLPFHMSCNDLLAPYCVFNVTADECLGEAAWPTAESSPSAFTWGFSQTFPDSGNKHDVVHRYYETAEACALDGSAGLTSAIITPIRTCQKNAIKVLGSWEYPIADGLAYSVATCHDENYQIDVYEPDNCVAANLQLTIEQPKYSCALVDGRGYMTSSCAGYSTGKVTIPRDAIYSLLLLLLLAPVLFYLGLVIASKLGCHTAKAESAIEMNEA